MSEIYPKDIYFRATVYFTSVDTYMLRDYTYIFAVYSCAFLRRNFKFPISAPVDYIVNGDLHFLSGGVEVLPYDVNDNVVYINDNLGLMIKGVKYIENL